MRIMCCSFQTSHIIYVSNQKLQVEFNLSPNIFPFKYSIIIINECLSYELKMYFRFNSTFSHFFFKKHLTSRNQSLGLIIKLALPQNTNVKKGSEIPYLSFI